MEFYRLCLRRTVLFLGGIEHPCQLTFEKFSIVLHYFLQLDLTVFYCQGCSLSLSMPRIVPDVPGRVQEILAE